jgi:hypothetical protein
MLTAAEVAPTRVCVTGAASDYSGAGRGTSGHRCVPSASLNSSVLLAISPLCRAKPRAVDQDSAGTAPRCNWLVGDSGRPRESVIAIAPSAGPAKMPGQCLCWSLVSV